MRFKRDINSLKANIARVICTFVKLHACVTINSLLKLINQSNSVLARAKSIIASDTRRPK